MITDREIEDLRKYVLAGIQDNIQLKLARLLDSMSEIRDRAHKMQRALERIERWDSRELPDVVSPHDGRKTSYTAAFGSNGERDFFRNIAAEALRGEKPYFQPKEANV